jgi:hypothetical protein
VNDTKAAKVPSAGATTKAGHYLEGVVTYTWTTKKPTAPGLYWYRKSVGRKAYVVDVELHRGMLRVDNKNTDQCRGEVATISGQWAGPLLPPK